jgi:DNA-binding transcriptional LysR family regulator
MNANPVNIERFSREISLRELRTVLAVAEQGSVSKAAEYLNITQPTVTRCLHELEAGLGVELFRRVPRGMVPTAYGEAFIRRCRRIMADIGSLGAEIDSMAHGIKGRVHVGAMPAAINSFLPLALLELQQRYPDICVSVREGSESDLLNGLRAREIDLAVGRLPSERDNPDLQNEVLLNDPLCFVVREGHAMLEREQPTVAESLTFPWVFPAIDSLAHRALESAFRTSGHDLPKVAIYSTSITCITRVVEGSDYIGPLPESMFRFGPIPAGIARLEMRFSSTLAPIGITRLRGWESLPATAQVEEALRQVCID